jgi:hypothetical protein
MERAIREACVIAGVVPLPTEESEAGEQSAQQIDNIVFLDAADCLARAYVRKLSALKGPETSQLEGKLVVLLEMGHLHTTVVVVKPQADLLTVTTERVIHSPEAGSFQFDCALYAHFATHIETKHHCKVCISALLFTTLDLISGPGGSRDEERHEIDERM